MLEMRNCQFKSPNKVIRSFRLHKAKEMIINDKMSMTDVAFASGFSSPAYFSSCFKKEFGISPSELN